MIGLSVTIPHLARVEAHLRGVAGDLPAHLERGLHETLTFLQREAAALTPRSGRSQGRPATADQWETEVVRSGNTVRGRLYNRSLVIRYLDEGTRPHPILPRRARVLRFHAQGRVVFARRVQHPGTPALNLLARLRERGQSEVRRIRLVRR